MAANPSIASGPFGWYYPELPCECGGARASHHDGQCSHRGFVVDLAVWTPIPLGRVYAATPNCRCTRYVAAEGLRA